MKVSKCFPSKFLKASDLPDGRDVLAQIDCVTVEPMEKTGDEKPVLHFIDKERGLVLNKTNSSVLSTAFGDESDLWHGKTVALFSTLTDFAGRSVPCIRLKVPKQQTAIAAAPVAAAMEEVADVPIDLPF